MKRISLIILLAAITLSGMAQTIGEAFYIYRNDGQFNAFFRDEVQSIEYSYYDADSVKYEDIVTQVVITADSVYKIPLAAIDSVGFVTPETKYKDGTIALTGNLYDYLTASDTNSLTFALSIPLALLPNVGDKIVATDLSNKLPLGFTGIVRQVEQVVDGYVVSCDSLALEEAVDRFYGVVEMVGQQDDGNVRRYLQRRAYSEQARAFHIVIPPVFNLKLDLSPFVNPKNVYEISGKAVVSTSISPVVTGRITRVVDNILNIDHYNVHAVTDVTTETTVEVVGEVSNKNNPFNQSNPNKNFTIEGTKLGPWGIPIYYAFSPNFDMNGEIALGTTIYANFTQTSDITYYPLTTAVGMVAPGLSLLANQFNTVTGSAKMTHFDIDWLYIAGNITASVSACGRLGIGLAAKGISLGWVGCEAQVGAKAEAELGFDFEALSNAEKGTGFYDGLKDKAKVTVMPYWGLEGKISVLDDCFSFTFIGRDDYSFWGQKWEWDFLPKFSDTKAMVSNVSNAMATADITNDCIIPYTVGFSLFDENGDRIGEPQWNEQKFWTRKSFHFPFKTTFSDISTDKKYKVYPTLRLFGFNVLASPSADIGLPFPVTLSNFKVTNKQYKENGFTHEGVAYDYRFDVTVTATLDDDVDEIAEWGYIYLDPNGKETFIPLNQFGHSYTDNRWAYFRKGTPPFTCTLYGYVKYVGSDETIYGEPHDYPLVYGETTCPDGNHPHMIDLGLPSGTKWACCNVGASTPEGYGNYYAWGETQPKSVYNWSTYQYYDDSKSYPECYVNIGSDIAGSSYDAATANWGAPWRMPSLTQIRELLNNTTSTWTTQNSVKGRKFTGPNGGTIFLPAAGYRWYGELEGAGSYGHCWSSTLLESYPSGAYYLSFNSWGAYWSSGYDCASGQSVRPVR